MTGIIAQEMGEVVRGSIHYRALFMVGLVLFAITLAINYGAQKLVTRYRMSIGKMVTASSNSRAQLCRNFMFWTFPHGNIFRARVRHLHLSRYRDQGSRTVFTITRRSLMRNFLQSPANALRLRLSGQKNGAERSGIPEMAGNRTRNPLKPPASLILPAEFGRVSLARCSSSSGR